MPTSQTSEVLQHLRRAVLLRDQAGKTDRQLLDDYVARGDESALAALVRQHGPMVWGVCRRILADYHDAEDAFQATFLVLVRKAASIASRELLANWLYGVARQTASKARVIAARRNGRERQMPDSPESGLAKSQRAFGNDCNTLLDQELSRLPDKYRLPIVLCYLEGRTRKEVARQLGLPEGTVGSRLARARAILAKRLARHGLMATGGMLTAALVENETSASVPASLVSSTIQAMSLSTAGREAGVISVKVVALVEGVLKTMFFCKLKTGIAVLLVLGMATLAATMLGGTTADHAAEGTARASAPLATTPAGPRTLPQPVGMPRAKPLLVQVRIVRPIGVKILFQDEDGRFQRGVPLVVPARIDLQPERSYRLKLTAIPSHPGLELYPTIEVAQAQAQTRAFLENHTIPLDFLADDFVQVAKGKLLTKVVYLSSPAGEARTLSSSPSANSDPLDEAEQRGTVLAVVRMGNIDLDRPRAGKPVSIREAKAEVEPRGTVQKIQGGLLVVSLGRKDGLQAGQTLEVFRTNPRPLYLGKLQVLYVQKDQAIGRMVRKMDEAAVQVNDLVAGSLPLQ